MKVVVSQSMFFPWVGFLEQALLADVFVYYDDVQFSKGSFTNRVQIKSVDGTIWMTVPLEGHKIGQRIDEVRIGEKTLWAAKHLAMLEQSFATAAFAEDALQIVKDVYIADYKTIGSLARASMMALFRYYEIDVKCRFVDVADLSLPGSSSERVCSVVQVVKGDEYITGHGARQYLDHALFERVGIKVSYMDYKCLPYPQLYGAFTPYVSALDLVANCGKDGIAYIKGGTRNWKNIITKAG